MPYLGHADSVGFKYPDPEKDPKHLQAIGDPDYMRAVREGLREIRLAATAEREVTHVGAVAIEGAAQTNSP